MVGFSHEYLRSFTVGLFELFLSVVVLSAVATRPEVTKTHVPIYSNNNVSIRSQFEKRFVELGGFLPKSINAACCAQFCRPHNQSRSILVVSILLLAMQSNFLRNVCCSQLGHGMDITTTTFLPPLDHDAVVEAHLELMPDLDSILQEVVSRKSASMNQVTTTLLSQNATRPRACRDLRSLMPPEERMDTTPRTVPRFGLRKRLDVFLEEELRRSAQDCSDMPDESENNISDVKKNKASTEKTSTMKSSKTLPPVVWVLEPGYTKDGTVRFKISTDAGACLILKYKEALESVGIIKKSANNQTYFQLYSIEGNVSRIVNPDNISDAIVDLVGKSKLGGGDAELDTTETSETKSSKRIDRRLYRFVLRRRWKYLVRRQVRIASGDSRKGPRILSMISPVMLFWKALSRRSRETF